MYQPVDIKRSMKYGNNYWEVYSPKIKRTVRFFSDLEYDNWVLIETNPNVINFCEQPKKIRYLFNGELVETIFDMWVLYNDGIEEFIEVKYSKELENTNPRAKRSIRQTTVQKLWCDENHFTHSIRTEKDIRGNKIYLNNMKQILSYMQTHCFNIEITKNIIFNCIKNQSTKIGDIVKNTSNLSVQIGMGSICLLIYKGYLNANIYERILDFETEVWIND